MTLKLNKETLNVLALEESTDVDAAANFLSGRYALIKHLTHMCHTKRYTCHCRKPPRPSRNCLSKHCGGHSRKCL